MFGNVIVRCHILRRSAETQPEVSLLIPPAVCSRLCIVVGDFPICAETTGCVTTLKWIKGLTQLKKKPDKTKTKETSNMYFPCCISSIHGGAGSSRGTVQERGTEKGTSYTGVTAGFFFM